jgi:lysyl-tRNA synthetase class 2
MSDWRPGVSRDALLARARLLAAIRAFFRERDVLEVDTPLLASYGVTDPAIEPLVVAGSANASSRFLQSSPEFAMKRLLAAGSGAIYQLGKAFRAAEAGSRHNPEFTMLEWYRPGFSLVELMHEVGALVGHCLGREGFAISSYRQLFLTQIGIDPWAATTAELEAAARERLDPGAMSLDADGWLDLLMSHCIEPALAPRGLVFVTDYPPSQAALARCAERDGVWVAERFELYVDGLELANGYRELLDPRELVARAARDNSRRRAAGQAERLLDPRLLAAMEAGLPDCSGVALGLDRLLMQSLGATSLDQVIPFDWSRS